jgi:hypothetical protein
MNAIDEIPKPTSSGKRRQVEKGDNRKRRLEEPTEGSSLLLGENVTEAEPERQCTVLFPPTGVEVPNGVAYAVTPIVLGSIQDVRLFKYDGEFLTSEKSKTFSSCGSAIRSILEDRQILASKIYEEEHRPGADMLSEEEQLNVEKLKAKLKAFQKIYLIAYCPRGGLKSWAVFFNREDFQEWTLDSQGSFYPMSKTKSFSLDQVNEAISWMVKALKESNDNLLKFRTQKKQATLAAMNR